MGEREKREDEKGERIETKGNSVNNLKRRIRSIDTYLYLLFSFLKAMSYRLDSAIKRCSFEY